MKTLMHNRLFICFITVLLFLLFYRCADFDASVNPLNNDLFFNDKNNPNTLKRYNDADLKLPPLVEYIVDFENPTSILYNNQLKKLCNYTKIPYKSTNLKSWNTNFDIAESTKVLCIFETKKLNNASISKILKFVSDGGTLYLPFACEDKRFGYLLGVKTDAEFSVDVTSLGIHFTEPFIPTLSGTSTRKSIVHYGLSGDNFDSSKIKVYATAINNPSYPTILERKLGFGRVINLNSSFEFEKMDRGILFSAMMIGLEGIPYPIANTNTIFLDDFPSPLYDVKMEPIKSEMNLSISSFVQKVWWPDMKDLAKKYKISYTAIPAFDYNSKTNPPFLFSQWDNLKVSENNITEPLSSWLMRDCLKNGHELGFHGYNHVSLIKRDWKTSDFIVTALEGVQKKWKVNNFGELPISYVPPSNQIDQLGIKQLKIGLPSLSFMCSLYLGETYDGGNREFDFDPYHFNLFDYPRISSGFEVDENSKYNIQSLYLYTGIWNHFVHPDDVFQIPSPFNKTSGNYDLRNSKGLGWRKTKGKEGGLLAEFDHYLNEFTQAFPQARFLNAREGGFIALDWRASKFNHRKEKGYYIVEELNPENSMSNNQYWFMYCKKGNAITFENQLKLESVAFSKTKYLDGYLYSIYTREPSITIKDFQEHHDDKLTIVFNNTKTDYYNYITKVLEHERGEDLAGEEKDLILLEIASLKQRIFNEENIDYDVWNKYAEYLFWDKKELEIWDMLEKHCSKYPTKNNVMYSQELEKIVWYPNDLSMEKWVRARLLVNPRDKDLLNSYVANFNTPENNQQIKEALYILLSVDSGKMSLFNYIQHLLWYEPKTALVELEKIQPNEDFRELATNIIWLYESEKNYQKAYDWSFYSDEIAIENKMEWLFILKQYDALIDEYNNHMDKNPLDYKTKALMSNYYHDMDKFKEAWILANELPESKEKESLRKALNADVIYKEDFLQQDLLANYPELFYDSVRMKITKTYRLKYGNFIESENEIQTNKDRKASLVTRQSYNRFDSKKNLHRFAGTYSEFYPLVRSTVDTIITGGEPVDDELIITDDNKFIRVYGVEYQFKNPFSFEKFQYWSRVRFEMDDQSQTYFQFGAGINKSFKKNFSSFQVNLFPVQTAPGHTKDIYQVHSVLYQSLYIRKKINASLGIESNYYTASNKNSDFETDSNIDFTFTMRVGWDDGEEKKSKFIPFLESSVVQGTSDLSDGYPYWMLEERLFGGGGLSYSYGLEDSDFKAKVEAAYFLDDYADQFQRFSGTVSYRLFHYTSIIGSFEIFNQDKFYSNTVQLGLKYNFKEKGTSK